MANIIPMAGAGSRFAQKGYSLPKPLIPVAGLPMIVRVIRNMPKSDKWIFIVRQEHIDQYQMDNIIRQEVKNAIILPVPKITEGQAITCLLAKDHLSQEEPIFIAACDNTYRYNTSKFESLKNDASVDCVVFTITKMEHMRRMAQSLGWAKLDDDQETIIGMSVKKPVSNDPYFDHAVAASFYFKKAGDYIQSTNLMVKENYRINNEFYIDALPIFMDKLKKRSVIFDVREFFSWGTPEELDQYLRVQNREE